MNTTLPLNVIPSLIGTATEPMNEEQSMTLLQVLSFETDRPDQIFDARVADSLGPLGLMLLNRIDSHGIKIHISLAFWVTTLSKGNPGNIVMWAWTLREMKIRAPKSELLLTRDWVDLFPMGVPTAESLSKIWDGQKGEGGNRLDNHSNWKIG